MFKKSLLLVSLFSVQATLFAQEATVPPAVEAYDELFDQNETHKPFYRACIKLSGSALGVAAVIAASQLGYIDKSYWNYYSGFVAGNCVSSLSAIKIYPLKSTVGKRWAKDQENMYVSLLVALGLSTAAIKYGDKAGYLKENFWKHFIACSVMQVGLERLLFGTPLKTSAEENPAVATEAQVAS